MHWLVWLLILLGILVGIAALVPSSDAALGLAVPFVLCFVMGKAVLSGVLGAFGA